MSVYTVEDAFVAALTGTPGDSLVKSYLGSGTSARLYDTQLPEGVQYPCAAFQRISTVPLYTHGAPDNNGVFQANNTNAGTTRFQVTVWADPTSVRPPNAARQIAEAIKNALKTFSAWDGSTRGSNRIENQRGGVEPQTQPPIPYQRFDVCIPYAEAQ
jgi:Protein of unknown function (DUF3168)